MPIFLSKNKYAITIYVSIMCYVLAYNLEMSQLQAENNQSQLQSQSFYSQSQGQNCE